MSLNHGSFVTSSTSWKPEGRGGAGLRMRLLRFEDPFLDRYNSPTVSGAIDSVVLNKGMS